MCKHVLNAQVSIRAPCCKSWFDCAKCHEEKSDHPLHKQFEMTFACKKCKKVFRKDLRDFQEEDQFCPGCDNHFWIEAKAGKTEEPQLAIFQTDDPEELKKKFGIDVFQDSREKQRKLA